MGSAAVLALDTIGSLASLRFKFAYARLAPVSYLLWALAGFAAVVGQVSEIRDAVALGALAGGVVGLVEATIGWWISWRLGPGRIPAERVRPGLIQRIVVIVAIRAALFGAAGGGLGFLVAPA